MRMEGVLGGDGVGSVLSWKELRTWGQMDFGIQP